MSLLVAWVLFPLVLLGLCAGLGLLVDVLSGRRLPGVLVAPAGLAAIVVVGQFTTLSDATAELTVPVLALRLPGRRLHPLRRRAEAGRRRPRLGLPASSPSPPPSPRPQCAHPTLTTLGWGRCRMRGMGLSPAAALRPCSPSPRVRSSASSVPVV